MADQQDGGVDLATQTERWRHHLKNVSTSGVTIDGSNVFVGDENGRLYEFDLVKGTPATWSPRGLGGATAVRVTGRAGVGTAQTSSFTAADCLKIRCPLLGA